MTDYITAKIAACRANGQLPAASTGARTKPAIVWQRVSDIEYTGASRYTGYIDKTIRLWLACGHDQYRKASQGVPLKARCKDCERAASQHSSQEPR